MRVTIFGGTGPAGQLRIRQALDAGHQVTAYARTPSKLPSHPHLTPVEGLLDDAETIATAIRGADAVLSVLGPGTNTADIPPLVDGYRNIVAAMHANGVERLIATGTPSITDPRDGKDLKVSLMVTAIKRFQPAAYRSLVEIGDIIRSSGLQWTIVRLPLLSNGPVTRQLHVRSVGAKGGIRLSRQNAAAYILQQLSDDTQIHRSPYISDK